MTEFRTSLDTEHPCVACGAPWRVTERGIEVAEVVGPIKWVVDESDCSRECFRQNLEAYNAGLVERRERGW